MVLSVFAQFPGTIDHMIPLHMYSFSLMVATDGIMSCVLDQMIPSRNNRLMKGLDNRNLLMMPRVMKQTVKTTSNRLLRLHHN